MVLKLLQLLGRVILIITLLKSLDMTIVQIVTMNNLTMVMTVLDGEEQLLNHGLLTVIVLAMLDNLSGQELTILENRLHGITKIVHLSRALTLVLLIQLVYQRMISTFTVVNGIVLKKSQLFAFYHIGTGLKRPLRIVRCWLMERFRFVPSQMLQALNCS